MPRKLYYGICRNCGSRVEKVYRSNGISAQTCPVCGYTSVYPFDLTGPMEGKPEPEPAPAPKPTPASIVKPPNKGGYKPVKKE